jgi:hypothetical protein
MGERIGACGEVKGRGPFGRSVRRWKNNIKMNHKEK